MSISNAVHTTQALELIVTLSDHPGMRASGLQEALDVSRATLMRILAEARHMGVVIGYSHESGYRVESGDVKLARKWLKLNQREAPLA
jgi:predicted DNA-binding transcriptional regulator YafY